MLSTIIIRMNIIKPLSALFSKCLHESHLINFEIKLNFALFPRYKVSLT